MRSHRPLLLLLISTLMACASLGPSMAAPHQFLERNYFAAKTWTDTSIIYEAQAVAHILLVDGLQGAYASASTDTSRRTAFARRLIVTPMFRLRQLHDSSAAVRTPSFMPRASVEWLWASRVGRDSIILSTNPLIPARLEFPGMRLFGLRATLAHHSNGQAGCFRDGFEPDNANECFPEANYDTTIVALNRADGDFSTTFLSMMAHLTLMNRPAERRPTHSIGAALSLDLHLPKPVFGALTDEQRSAYGWWRVRLQAEGMQRFGTVCEPRTKRLFCRLHGRTRIAAELEVAPRHTGALGDRMTPRVVPYRVSAEASHAIDALLGMGAFVRVHNGQDYYNIGFARRRRVVMAGFMLDVSGLEQLRTRVVQ